MARPSFTKNSVNEEDKQKLLDMIQLFANENSNYDFNSNDLDFGPGRMSIVLNNKIIDKIPNELGKLNVSKLRLELNNNKIKEIPKEIGNLKEVNKFYLDLTKNKIQEIPIEIFDINVKNYFALLLNDNNINEIPTNIFNLKVDNLELFLNNNLISEIPNEINDVNFDSFTLGLNDNNIKKIPPSIGNLKVNNIKLPYQIVDKRDGDLDETYCIPKKAFTELGWSAKYNLEDICLDSWNYYKKICFEKAK